MALAPGARLGPYEVDALERPQRLRRRNPSEQGAAILSS